MKQVLAFLLVVGLVIGGLITLKVYRYKDCKKVGHSTFYCLTDK